MAAREIFGIVSRVVSVSILLNQENKVSTRY